MKKYTGQFKDINNVMITVDIIPSNGSYTAESEVRFIGDEPVLIEADSADIFEPIKTQSCTITLFTEEIYWDLYTPESTGYYVHVYNDKSSLFDGYLTPCIYTQDYAYKSEIELEAVDYLAILDTFEYKVEGDREIISVSALLNKIFGNVPNYKSYQNKSGLNLNTYFIQEANFFDDDDEPMTCKEILEELCRYLGLTATMYNGVIYLIDYNTSTTESNVLTVDRYGEGTPTIELDEVYNKISFGCDLYEVEDVIDDVIDDDNKTVINEFKIGTSGEQLFSDYSFSWREHGHHTTDKHRYTMLIKPYQFVDESIADDKSYKISRWKSYSREISTNTLVTTTIEGRANSDINTYKDSEGDKLFIPQYLGAYAIRQYSYSKAEGMASKTKINWEDYLLFPALQNKSTSKDRRRYPAITFNNDSNLAYSIDGGTGYLLFQGDLWCQSDIGISGVDTDVIWLEAKRNGTTETVATPVCMENMDLSFDEDRKRVYRREKGGEGYNEGWAMIKAQLKIGNKYWNGSTWTTTNSTFDIKYHDDDVNGDDETLSYFTWLRVAPNSNIPKYNVGDDGYAIPITAADRLNGKLEFTLYTPNQLPRTINNFFMRDMKLKYIYKDSSNWADDKKADEDIVYENIINEDWAVEMDEIDLKINSWYKDKPISKSYFLDSNKLPVITINGKVQEERLLEKYYNHYSTPKKIFNLNYKITNTNPLNKYYHTQTDTYYFVGGYEYNVQRAEAQLRLIEL